MTKRARKSKKNSMARSKPSTCEASNRITTIIQCRVQLHSKHLKRLKCRCKTGSNFALTFNDLKSANLYRGPWRFVAYSGFFFWISHEFGLFGQWSRLIWFEKLVMKNLTEPGHVPETSGLPYQCSSIWAIQPLDGVVLPNSQPVFPRMGRQSEAFNH